MALNLPIRTTVDDIRQICDYLGTKATGATLKEAKSVLPSKVLDSRKLAAYKIWGLVEEREDGKYRVTPLGRSLTKNDDGLAKALARVIRTIEPYRVIIERAAHRGEIQLTSTEVAAHWDEHFPDQASDSEKILNDQAICFFHLVDGAGLGTLVVGRRGSATRVEFNKSAIETFVTGGDPASRAPVVESKPDDSDLQNTELADQARDEAEGEERQEPEEGTLVPADKKLGQAIFIAHGKNKKPVEQLKKILEQFQIPYRVAVEEPNLGRPIGSKVRQIMESCNCAILIFTADEEFQGPDGETFWRPNENVIYELGAAGYLYDSRLVIMKEEGVSFPTNFRDIGYIEFEKDQLEARSMDILRELIGFGIVKVST